MEAYAKKDYWSFTVKELISELKKRGIGGYGGKTKVVLINMLEEDDKRSGKNQPPTKKKYKREGRKILVTHT